MKKLETSITFGVELESEVSSEYSLSNTRGRITFTERSIYLGTGKNKRVLYDGKSLDFAMKYKGSIDTLPKVADAGDVYLNKADNGLYIRNNIKSWDLISPNISNALLDGYVDKKSKETITGSKTFTSPITLDYEPKAETDAIRLKDLNEVKEQVSQLSSVMRFQGKLLLIASLDTINEPQVGDTYFIEEDGNLYTYSKCKEWVCLDKDGGIVDLTNYYTKDEVNDIVNRTKEEILANQTTSTTIERVSISYEDDTKNINLKKQGYKFVLGEGYYPMRVLDGNGLDVAVQTYYEKNVWVILVEEEYINHTAFCLKFKTN